MNTDPFVLNPLLKTIRQEFIKGQLSEETIEKDPLVQFETWLKESFANGNLYANAMVLSTVGTDGMPSQRVMLLRDLSFGGFTFFTNQKSEKGRQLENNHAASLLFFWPEMERQVRVQGFATPLPSEEADSYFESRPFESQVGAWASQQSEKIAGRADLEKKYRELLEKHKDQKVPRPSYWGGYVLKPEIIEFWQGRENRLHDRLRFTRVENNNWELDRLMP